MSQITITFDDGIKRNYNQENTFAEILKETFPKKSNDVIAAVFNDQVRDLSNTVKTSGKLSFLTCNEPEGLQVFWHSASHVMAHAVKSLYPDTQLGIGPSISNGFYYDFSMKESLNDDDLIRIEEKMQEIVESDYPFVHSDIKKNEANSLFQKREEHFKLELIADLPDNEISVYQNEEFVDLCRGPHVPSTGYIKHFKLMSLAGAYWHGDERNPMMQRIYGVAYPDKKQLKKHLLDIENAKKRDHRRLGKELDLFSFQAEGPGFPFWHHNGMVICNETYRYMRETLTRHGYQEINTPLILNEDLWHKSGHWDNYKANMYFTTIDEQSYAVKPMNCPGGLLVYKNKPHSYRDLPLKLSEMGLVHRHEKSGVLHGLFRVRQFTQDDAHVYCTPDQLEEEIINLINIVEEVYHAFGYEDFQMELSTRPAKSIGSDKMWKDAEKALKNALGNKNATYQINPGEGAFYGPKIDYHIKDSLGRFWQCGTIQVDFSMPERFDLEYIGSDGEKHRPVMLHRAILGSVERFIGILIEHYGGAFPVWLSPVQCIILPISEKHIEHAEGVHHVLLEKGIRCNIDNRSEKIGYKIREAETQKIPYMCIIGDQEIADSTISVRKRRVGNMGAKKVETFSEEILDERGGSAIKKEEVRINEDIRAKEVRLIDPDGKQIGITPIEEAIQSAESFNLDLVEISPNASPPVCRIMDFGKFKYQQSKKEKESRKKQHVIHIKEIRLRPTIDEHDINFKMRQARKFIESGNHLKIRILFRGRQIVHPELGHAVLQRVQQELEDIAKMESNPLREGRSIIANFVQK